MVSRLIGAEFVVAYSGLILAFALGSWLFLSLGAARLHKDIRRASEVLRERIGEAEEPGLARAALSNAWGAVEPGLQAIAGIRHAWEEFVECLIVPSDGERTGGMPIRNTRDPAFYFSRENVVAPSLSLRFYEAVPGILTGLGILGTFIGLAAGITLAQEGLATENEELIREALRQLLGGASLAFITSITGLATSLAFVVIERRVVDALDRSLAALSRRLDRCLERTTPEKVAVLQLDQLREQTSELKMFNTDLVISIASALDEKVAGRLGPLLDRIAEATEGLRTEQATATQDMLDKIVEKFGETMSGAAGKEFEAISGSLRELDVVLQQSVGAMSDQQAKSTEVLSQLSDEVAKTLTRGSVEIQAGVQRGIELLTRSAEDSLAGFNDRFQEASELSAALAKQNAEEVSRQIGAAILSAGDVLGGVAERVARGLEAAGAGATERIDSALSELAARALDLSRGLEKASLLVESLSEASRSVDAAAGGVDAVLEGLKMVAPGLTNASEAIRTAGNSITSASESIKGFGEVSTRAAKQLSDSNDRMQEAWARYVDRFDGTDEALAEVLKQMEDGLDSFTQRVVEFNRNVDREFGKAIGTLVSAIEQLDATLDERTQT